MSDIRWINRHIEVDPPARPKKITGTRFGAILGLNRWCSPFKAWCEITRTWQEPFVDTKYTRAGKIIEPKQAQYLHEAYAMPNIFSPQDRFGEDFFKKTHGDFFPQEPIFGGMWDYIVMNIRGRPKLVLEMKTTKRAEDWQNDIPEYYAMQAALYAHLLHLDDVAMVCSFLKEEDYDHPEEFVPSLENTVVVPFKVSKRYPEFDDIIARAETFWRDHVLTGISPDYDERRDAEILKALRTNDTVITEDASELLEDIDNVKRQLDLKRAEAVGLENLMKRLSERLREYAKTKFREGDDRVTLRGENYVWTLARSPSTVIDRDALQRDGLLDKYSRTEETYRLTATSASREEKKA